MSPNPNVPSPAPADPGPSTRPDWVATTQLVALAYVLWLPVSKPALLYPLLAVLAGSSVIMLRRSPVRLDSWLARAAALYGLFLLLWSIYSVLRGNPGVWHQLTIFVGTPLIWGCWALTLRGEHLRRTVTVILAVCLVTSVTVLAYACHALQWLPFPGWLEGIQGAGYSVTGGEIRMRYYGLSTLAMAAPFALAAACLPHDRRLPPRPLVVLTAVLAFIASVNSGRRIVILLVLFVPVITLAVHLGIRWRRSLPLVAGGRSLLGATAVGLATALLVVSPLGAGIRGVVMDAVYVVTGEVANHPVTEERAGGNTTPDAYDDRPRVAEDAVRLAPAQTLIDEWRKSPVVGQGFGAVPSQGTLRNEERPWLFELQYHQLLMNVGLLGALWLLAIAAILARRIQLAARRPEAFAVGAAAAAAICVLVANETNPYLQAVGHGWGIFLVLGAANAALTHDRPLSEQTRG